MKCALALVALALVPSVVPTWAFQLRTTCHDRHAPSGLELGRRLVLRALPDEDVEELWWEPAENDIVEYALPEGGGGALGVGVVLNSGEIHPLCVFAEGGTTYVWDEEVPSLPGELVVRVVDDVYPTTRQAQRGVDNPHGEHAEDVFIIEDGVLDEKVVVAVRPERDIVW